MSYITSPTSGKLIKVGGEEYERLIKLPKYKETFLSPVNQTFTGKVETSGSAPPLTLPPFTKTPPRSLPPLSPVGRLPPLIPEPSISLAGKMMPQLPKSPGLIETSLPPLSLKKDAHLNTIVSMPLYDIPSLENLLEKTKQPAKRAKIQEMIDMEREKEGRGIKTRGWSARAPTRGKERHQLKAECGDKCFLLPELEKFPICPSPRITGGKSVCEIDCGGVQAAKVRAAQWKYPEVEAKADVLLEKCNKAGIQAFTPLKLPPMAAAKMSPEIESLVLPTSPKVSGKMSPQSFVLPTSPKVSGKMSPQSFVLPTSPKVSGKMSPQSFVLPTSPKLYKSQEWGYAKMSPSHWKNGKMDEKKASEGCGCGM